MDVTCDLIANATCVSIDVPSNANSKTWVRIMGVWFLFSAVIWEVTNSLAWPYVIGACLTAVAVISLCAARVMQHRQKKKPTTYNEQAESV